MFFINYTRFDDIYCIYVVIRLSIYIHNLDKDYFVVLCHLLRNLKDVIDYDLHLNNFLPYQGVRACKPVNVE